MVKRIPLTIKIACYKTDEGTKGKCVETLGGIDKVIGCRLKKQGIDTVEKLRKQTECMTKCEFLEYMCCMTGANRRWAGMAYKSLYGCVTELSIENKLAKTCAKCRH